MKSNHHSSLPHPSRFSSNPFQGVHQYRPQLKETQTHFLFVIRVPGLQKENLNLEICMQRHLIISDHQGGFFQTITLPAAVLSDDTKASYSHETLQVLLRKAPIENGTQTLQ